MKTFFLLLLMILLSVKGYSQKLNIEACVGSATYKMNDLKNVNETVSLSLPFNTEITEDFPGFVYNKFIISYSFKRFFTLGVFWSYNSTGSRIHYKDYSGEYRFDNIISSHMPGIDIKYTIIDNVIDLSMYNDAGFAFTNLFVQEELKVFEFVESDEMNFIAHSFQTEPGIKAEYSWKFLNFGIFFGYLFDFNKTLHIKDHPEIYYYNFYMNSNINEDWSGFRYGISLSLNMYFTD